MKKFIEEVGCKRMAVGLALCLLLSAWILPVEAGTLQDIGKTGKKAAMGTEKAGKDIAKGTEKGAKGAVKGVDKQADVMNDAEGKG